MLELGFDVHNPPNPTALSAPPVKNAAEALYVRKAMGEKLKAKVEQLEGRS
jgi:hypothetical protein